MASNPFGIPGFSAGLPLTVDGAKPSQLFSSWLSNMLAGVVSALNSQQSQTNSLAATLAALQAAVTQIQAAQALAAAAQKTADTASGGTAVSGFASANAGVNDGTTWVTVATVNLTSVVAGHLTISGSGPQQIGITDITPDGNYICAWRIVENPGSTVVFSGTFTASKLRDVELNTEIIVLYNNDDTSTTSIARTTTGSISYILQFRGVNAVIVGGIFGYIFVRRGA